MGLEIVTHVEVITEIMKASEAGKRQNTKMAEKPGAHGKDLQFLHFQVSNRVTGSSVNCFPVRPDEITNCPGRKLSLDIASQETYGQLHSLLPA